MSTTMATTRPQVPHPGRNGAPSVATRESGRWALRRTRRSVLAAWWGVSETRVSHRLTEGETALAEVLDMVEDPDVDGQAIVAAVLEALERRYMREAKEDRAAFDARLALLLAREHDREAAQNRALQTGENEEEACLSHASDLIEIAARKRVRKVVK